MWFSILDSQIETGTPYMLYKDAANRKSNQQNIGMIKSSNLCTEIIEYSDDKETAVCNLASIGLSKFVENGTFNFEKLHDVTRVITHNLNNIIDLNFYPTNKTYRSNMLHRPIGIGIQGLADVFAMLDYSFDCEEARELNKNIFETIYHAALTESCAIAKDRQHVMQSLLYAFDTTQGKVFDATETIGDIREWSFQSDVDIYERKYQQCVLSLKLKECLNDTKPIRAEFEKLPKQHLGAYSSFEGSPASRGMLQFDLWGVIPSDRYNWTDLKKSIQKWGIRNSLLLAPMPTASTSQILGNNECFEPFTSNIYVRRTIAGEYVIMNKYLMKELCDLGLWNLDLKNEIIANNGSIQSIDSISDKIKKKYRTVWELSMKSLIEMARDRGAFICQSQSMNLWIENPNYDKLTAMHFFSWGQGLKTGLYYLRTKAKAAPQQFTIDPSKQKNTIVNNDDNDDDECMMCSG